MRVGLVGYGLSGRFFHRPLLQAVPGMEVTSVVTSDPQRRRQAQEEIQGVRILASADELWASAGDHDLAVLASPTAAHVPQALAALDAGLPVVVEKPMAPSAEQCRALVSASRAADRALVPFFNRRFDADHRTLRRLLHEGTLGTVLRYESRFERFRPNADALAWRERTPSRQGGGVLLDLGTHLVDQALGLFGRPRAVFAEIEGRRGGADDDVFMALEMAHEVHVHLWAGALAGAPGPRLRVLGTDGALVVPELDGQERALRSGMAAGDPAFGREEADGWGWVQRGDARRPVQPDRGDWVAFYRQLHAALTGTAPMPTTAEDALAVAEVLDAARISAETRAVVDL